jgi:Icc-related predicted phosphoesterase
MTELIEERGPDLWMHGHVHRHADYRVGRTRIVCNARGHHDETTAFQPQMVITATPNA